MADGESTLAGSCPLPHLPGDRILLGHGSGGTLSDQLIREVFLAHLDNPVLARLEDQATLDVEGLRLAFTTDSFVVQPLFFPGGDIGTLAVHGTVNDLAMGGARPLFLSAAFIIEEGLPIATLERVVASLRAAAAEAGVEVVTGDTKVVDRGSADGLFINTSGIGLVPADLRLSAEHARPGDAVLLSGAIGEHGIAVLAQRNELALEGPVRSDTAALYGLVHAMLDAADGGIRCLRDPTRGGVSSTLNEIARSSGVSMTIEEPAIPVREEVRGACEILGLDPLYVANEGRLVCVVDDAVADRVVEAMRGHRHGRDATRIGRVGDRGQGLVTMRTALGTTRIVDMLAGAQLPRIC